MESKREQTTNFLPSNMLRKAWGEIDQNNEKGRLITKDDMVDLKILLNTTTVDEFLTLI